MPDAFLVPGPMSFLGVGISGPMFILGGRVSLVPCLFWVGIGYLWSHVYFGVGYGGVEYLGEEYLG